MQRALEADGEKLRQLTGEDHGPYFISGACDGESCRCGKPVRHKIEETILFDDPMPGRHPLTTYVCHECFTQLMGPKRIGIASA
jgi:hypothetical protein